MLWKIKVVCLFKGESVVKMDLCGGGNERCIWLSKALGVEELAGKIDLSGECPMALDFGGRKIVFLPKESLVFRFSPGTSESIKSQEFCDCIFAVSET